MYHWLGAHTNEMCQAFCPCVGPQLHQILQMQILQILQLIAEERKLHEILSGYAAH